jgi:hypothetical protein
MTATIGNTKMEAPWIDFRIYEQSLNTRITIVLAREKL